MSCQVSREGLPALTCLNLCSTRKSFDEGSGVFRCLSRYEESWTLEIGIVFYCFPFPILLASWAEKVSCLLEVLLDACVAMRVAEVNNDVLCRGEFSPLTPYLLRAYGTNFSRRNSMPLGRHVNFYPK